MAFLLDLIFGAFALILTQGIQAVLTAMFL